MSSHSRTSTRLTYTFMATPVGRLTLAASDRGLAAILWEHDRPGERVRVDLGEENDQHPVLLDAKRELTEYFTGRRQTFAVPLDWTATGTAFQQAVWGALLTIPFGETRSYGQVAEQLGRPDAVRAVGAANGRNPLSIMAPCHRVVGAAGALTGFAGGLEAKAWLLRLEGARSAEVPVAARRRPRGDGPVQGHLLADAR